MTFYERITALRKEKGVNQKQVQEELGLGKNAFGDWKRGVMPQSATQQVLAQYFGVSVDYLMGKTDNPFPHSDRIKEPVSPVLPDDKKDEMKELPDLEQTLLLYFENCDAIGQMRIIQVAMNEHDRTQKEKTGSTEEPVIG